MIVLRRLIISHNRKLRLIRRCIYCRDRSRLTEEISSCKSLLWYSTLRANTRRLLLSNRWPPSRWSSSRKSKWIAWLTLSCLTSRAFLRLRFASNKNILREKLLKLAYRLFSRFFFCIPYYSNYNLSAFWTCLQSLYQLFRHSFIILRVSIRVLIVNHLFKFNNQLHGIKAIAALVPAALMSSPFNFRNCLGIACYYIFWECLKYLLSYLLTFSVPTWYLR